MPHLNNQHSPPLAEWNSTFWESQKEHHGFGVPRMVEGTVTIYKIKEIQSPHSIL